MLKISYRIAGVEDVMEILFMMEDFNAIDHYLFDRDKAESNLREFIQNPELGRLWLIEESDKTAGYMVLAFGYSFEYGGRDAFIDELFLKDDHRGKGIGDHAMDFLQQNSPELGIKALHLEVESHNPQAHRLYLKKGFRSGNRMLMTRRV